MHTLVLTSISFNSKEFFQSAVQTRPTMPKWFTCENICSVNYAFEPVFGTICKSTIEIHLGYVHVIPYQNIHWTGKSGIGQRLISGRFQWHNGPVKLHCFHSRWVFQNVLILYYKTSSCREKWIGQDARSWFSIL